MNFFEHQDHARQQTRRLIALFMLAVICIVVAVNLTLGAAWLIVYPSHHGPWLARLPNHFIATNTALTLLFIVGGMWVELWRLRDGGDAVAQMAGARLLKATSQDLCEQRLANIVEEMALASGVAMPKIYVMEREPGINAFAAGYGPNEAIIAVTQGALRRLSRDEMQGVIGHEFSHILNGDMRLNLRLMGVLYGILLISGFGQELMSWLRYSRDDSSRDNGGKNSGAPMLALFVAGFCLWIIGYIGVFFARLIKSAVSRQREFLADASAIQFTRNAEGIGGALRKIGGLSSSSPMNPLTIGSEIRHPNAENLSHMFLSAARPAYRSGWLATHPPLAERLRRIYGRSMAMLPSEESAETWDAQEPMLAPLSFDTVSSDDGAPRGFAASAGGAAHLASALDVPHPSVAAPAIPQSLREAARIPISAQYMVLTLLLDADALQREAQIKAAQTGMPDLQAKDVQKFATDLQALAPGLRYALIDLATPALKLLSPSERARFLRAIEQMIVADGRVTLDEFVLQTIVTRRLDAYAGRAVPIRFKDLNELVPDLATVLSLVAHIAGSSLDARDAKVGPQQVFNIGAQALALDALVFMPRHAINFDAVQRALDRLNQLAPLKKPLLIKALVLAVRPADTDTPSTASIDVLRAISAALDVPSPLADKGQLNRWS